MRLIKKKSWDETGVSEVIGTILILGMTVVLFSAVLLWIYAIPTPTPDVKVDFQGTLQPIYKTDGTWNGVNITLRHNGGEALTFSATRIYMNIQRGSSRLVDQLKLRGTLITPPDGGKPYGLVDGPDNSWDLGERWAYTNHSIQQNDRIDVSIINLDKSVLLWQRTLQGLSGLNPPVFIEKYADMTPSTPTLDTPKTGSQFYLYAHVIDPDGDLNKNSVYTTITAFYGSKDFKENPQKMKDDGTGADQVANDNIFTFTATWLIPGNITWDGSVVIFNATDLAGHKTTSRMTLSVLQGPSSGTKKPGTPGSGAPPNLNYNGLQGYNIFNGTEWDDEGFNASETRMFKEGEEVVLVVGSAILKDTFGRDMFTLYDPFSNTPLDPVVYGSDKEQTETSIPSTTQAFQFFLYVSGYNVWIYRFELNNATISTGCTAEGGVCFSKTPSRPLQYYFGIYPLEIDIIDFLGNRFTTSDTITIAANDGWIRNYPALSTFSDSAYTHETNVFDSVDMVYVQVTMKTVDSTITNVLLGNIVIQDFIGGLQVFRAPKNGHDANPPICPITGACSSPPAAVSIDQSKVVYRFAINLSRADQDPWVEGSQHYALRLLTIDDSDEHYSLTLSSQLVIRAPLFRMDAVEGFEDSQNPAWGSHDVSRYLVDWNGVDKWTSGPLELPYPKQQVDYTQVIRFIDFNGDGKLDVAAYIKGASGGLNLYRQDSDQGGSIQWTKTTLEVPGNPIADMRAGNLNRDMAPELVVAAGAQIWYYLNDGTWTIPGQTATKVFIDSGAVRTTTVNAIDLGDFNGDGFTDVAVGRNGGKVVYYVNDGNGQFTSTEQTDRWYAEYEETTTGTRGGTYSNTLTQNGIFENLKEATVDLSAASGGTVNAAFDDPNQDGVAATNWTFSGWTGYNPGSASGHKHTSGGNPVHDFSVHMACVKSGQVGGYIQQSFSVSVQGVSATLTLDWKFLTKGSTASNMQFYAFLSATSGAPTPGSGDEVWNSGQLTSTTSWGNQPMVSVDVSSRVSSPGTYYLKVGVITTNGNANCGTESVGLFDNAQVYWSRAAGQSSQLVHYYQIQQLPNRPSSTYTFRIYGHRTDNNSEGDNFVFAFSENGQTGSYTNMVTVNSATDMAYTYTMPTSIAGKIIWVRVQDANLGIGRTNLDLMYVDQLYIEVYTAGGQNGQDISLPGDTSNVIAIGVGNTNDDAFDDVYAGTANNNVFRIRGYSGGLEIPTGALVNVGAAITSRGLNVGNVTGNGIREVAVAVGINVKVYNGITGALVATATHSGAQTITSMAMGDIDGNGYDDFLVGGTSGELTYYRRLAGSWQTIIIPNVIYGTPIDTKIWDVDIGDLNKAQYVGR